MVPGSTINAICPYYTMFPLEFPMRVIRHSRCVTGWVADPFCGRGTTNLAARLSGLPTFGLDSSPIAAAIARAKLCDTSIRAVIRSANEILLSGHEPQDVPVGDFWEGMYHSTTLRSICILREALIQNCRSDARRVLRAILLGALHGPLTKQTPSHLSNQSPRTYAPKPDYAVRFWQERNMAPPQVDVLEVIRVRAERYLTDGPAKVDGVVKLADSRQPTAYPDGQVGLVITSPPYYGMRTYVSDQWIRAWFLGGPSTIDYRPPTRELQHSSPEAFTADLRRVWAALVTRAHPDARLVIRFGGINDRQVDHVAMLKESLAGSGWRLRTIRNAGNANTGKRQATQFLRTETLPQTEYDYYASLS